MGCRSGRISGGGGKGKEEWTSEQFQVYKLLGSSVIGLRYYVALCW